MTTIGGKKREQSQAADYVKKVGLFEANVIGVNLDADEYKELIGIEVKEDSKMTEYTSKSDDGIKKLRVDFWLEEVKTKEKFKVTFWLEDREKENKDGTKKQFINEVGVCSWAADENDLPDWFKKREHRVANVGEEDLYNFMRTWLGKLDYRDAGTVLQLDWKTLMRGNVKDIKAQINGEYCNSVLAMATVKSTDKDGETKEYQSVYNRAFLPAFYLKQFRLIDYHNPEIVGKLKEKKSKDLKPFERFVVDITGEYGCKDFYTFRDLKEYNPSDNITSSDKVIAADDSNW